MILRPVDVVGDDEEVCREVHFRNDAELVVQTLLKHLPVFRRCIRISAIKAFICQCGQIFAVRSILLRNAALWQDRAGKLQLKVAPIGHFQRIGQELRMVWKQLRHFIPGTEIVFLLLVSQTVRLMLPLLGSDAEHGVVQVPVFLHDVVYVIGSHDLDPQLGGYIHKDRRHTPFIRKAMVLDLDVETVAEDFLEPAGTFGRAFDVTLQDQFRKIPRYAGGQTDQM